MRRLLCATVLFGVCASALAAVDCSRPKTTVERFLCTNDRVSEANQQMAFAFLNAYRRVGNDEKRAVMREQQREWEAQVRDVCQDVPCLMRAYYDRTLELDQN